MNNKKLIVLAAAVALAIAAAYFKVDIKGILSDTAAIEKQVAPLLEDEAAVPAATGE